MLENEKQRGPRSHREPTGGLEKRRPIQLGRIDCIYCCRVSPSPPPFNKVRVSVAWR